MSPDELALDFWERKDYPRAGIERNSADCRFSTPVTILCFLSPELLLVENDDYGPDLASRLKPWLLSGKVSEKKGVSPTRCPMFEMIDEDRRRPKDRKLFLIKSGAFVVALAALAGVIYFCIQSVR